MTSSASDTTPLSRAFDGRPFAIHDWLAMRAISRDHNISHRNLLDARRLAGRSEGNAAMPEDENFTIDSPTTTINHHHPAPSGGFSQLLGPLALAGSLLLGPAAGIAVWNAPEIVAALRGPAAAPATPASPASAAADPLLFELFVGPPPEDTVP